MGRVQVSFKNNYRERILEEAVNNAIDKSAFVKECIEFYLANKDAELKPEAKDPKEVKEVEIDNIDWEF